MKRFLKGAGVATLAVGILAFEASCGNMSLPKSVAVKTSAEYNVALGNASFDMSQFVSKDDLLAQVRESMGGAGVDMWEYEEGDALTFLIHKSIYDIPLDIDKYLSDMNLDDKLTGTNGGEGIGFSYDITLPEVSVNQSQTIAVSELSDQLMGKLKTSDASLTLDTVPELGQTADAKAALVAAGNATTAIVKSGYYTAIKYGSGSSLDITVTKTDGTPVTNGYAFTLSASIPAATATVNGTTYGFNGSTASANVTNGGTLSLPLDKGVLPSEFTISFGGTLSGGTLGTNHKYAISVKLSDGSSIDTIYGVHPNAGTVDTSDDLEPVEQDLPKIEVPLGNDIAKILESATVANEAGNRIKISAKAPNGWSGVTADIDGFAVTGLGLETATLSEGDTADGGANVILNKQLDLRGKTITPGSEDNLTVGGKVKITVQDGATLTFKSGDTIDVGVTGGITKLSAAKVKFSGLGDNVPTAATPKEIKVPLPEELRKAVKSISFGTQSGDAYYKSDKDGNATTTVGKGFGITAKVVNQLPKGSDITLTMKCAEFGNFDKTLTLSGTGTTTAKDATCTAYPMITFSDSVDEATFKVYLPNDAEFKDLAMGSTYKVGVSDVEFVCDWDKVVLNLEGLMGDTDSITGEVKLDDLDFTNLLTGNDDMPDFVTELFKSVELTELPVYFYAQKPTGDLANLVGDVSFKGNVGLSYKDKTDAAKTENLVGDGTTAAAIQFKNGIPWPEKDVSVVKSATFGTYLTPENSSFALAGDKIPKILADSPKDFKLNYDISIDGAKTGDIIITSALIDSLSEGASTKIAIDMAAKLPFSLNLTQPVTVDLMQMLKDSSDSEEEDSEVAETKDLLGRDDVSSTSEYKKYAHMIDYVSINYRVQNDLLPGLDLSVTIDDTKNPKASQLKKTMPLNSSTPLKFEAKDIEDVMTHVFTPEVTIQLGRSLTTAEEASGKYATPLTLYIARDALSEGGGNLGADISITVKMNGDNKISVWGGKD